jgi:T-complex protein 1 subunit theta
VLYPQDILALLSNAHIYFAHVGTIQKATKAKIAIYMSGIDVALTETKGTVLIKNAADMLNFSKGEESALEASIKQLADAGVKVVVSGSSIGELALHFLNRYNMLVVKVLSKFDLRRLCRVAGATALTRFVSASSAPTLV